MLGQLACPCSTAHPDILQGPAETRHPMSLKMSHRDEGARIQITATDLGCFYETLIDLHIKDIFLFPIIRDENIHPHSFLRETMGHGDRKMIFRIEPFTAIKRIGI